MTVRYVVVDNHTLGAIIGKSVQILSASVLRGAGDNAPQIGLTWIRPESRMRTATRQDFAEFMVSPKGHLPPEATP